MTVPFNYSRKHLLVLTVGLSVLILLLSTATSVSAQEFREKYHACVNKASGLVTFVDPDEECKSAEYRIILYDATEIDETIASLESRIQSLEIQATGLDSAVADEALARSSADGELSSQILTADQSISILETQMGEVDIILDDWWGDVGSLPIPIPKPAWFDNVNIALGDYASLPIPIPEPAWFEDVEFILDDWWGDVGSLPIPIPKPAWFDQVSLDITLMTQDILDIWGTLPGPMP